jgi:hypothetical protein
MMEPAREELAAAIEATTFQPHMSGVPKCNRRFDPNEIKKFNHSNQPTNR